jgi:competence protein ComEC
MRRLLGCLVPVLAWSMLSGAQTQSTREFEIYVIDVEGGEATLFVSPSGESLLVDTGWPGFDGRDADRILAAARHAGITQIDYLVTTHYHADHAGGAAPLAARLPIRHFVDHGSDIGDDERTQYESYSTIRGKGPGTEAKPGDTIPVAGVSARIIAAGGAVLRTPLTGQGASNPFCAGFQPHGPEITSRAADAGDSRSVSLLLTYGNFRTIIMGDLTWNKEFDLMCPANRIGTVDLFVVSHHGQPVSNADVLVHAIQPRVAIMNNGTRKGGQPDAMKILFSAPGLEDLWQVHFSLLSGQEYTVPGLFIANTIDEAASAMPVAPMAPTQPAAGAPPPPAHNGPANWIKVSAQSDGTFTVTNARNGFNKTYKGATRTGGN